MKQVTRLNISREEYLKMCKEALSQVYIQDVGKKCTPEMVVRGLKWNKKVNSKEDRYATMKVVRSDLDCFRYEYFSTTYEKSITHNIKEIEPYLIELEVVTKFIQKDKNGKIVKKDTEENLKNFSFFDSRKYKKLEKQIISERNK